MKYRTWYKTALSKSGKLRSRNGSHVVKANCQFATWSQNYKLTKMRSSLASELKSTTNRTDKQPRIINRSTSNVQSKHAEASRKRDDMLRCSKAIRLAISLCSGNVGRTRWGVKESRGQNNKSEKKKREKKKETHTWQRETLKSVLEETRDCRANQKK